MKLIDMSVADFTNEVDSNSPAPGGGSVSALASDIGVSYQTHIQNEGWQSVKSDGEMSGTEGKSLRLEGIEIKLVNVPSEYHVQYRVHVQDVGWQSWRSDGEMAGTQGMSKRLEAIEIRIVKEKSLINALDIDLNKDIRHIVKKYNAV